METLLAFLIGFIVTFFFVHRYVKNMAGARRPAAAPAAPVSSGRSTQCPRCGKPMSCDSSFCPGCGASMALWNVHRAAVKQAGAPGGEKGKPRPVINATLCIGCGSCVRACPETGTLAVQGGKAILAHPERCVGHAKCVEVCPTSAISLAFGSVLQTLRVPMVREDFETNVPNVFIVGELSGMALIKTAINEGRLVIDEIRRRLEAKKLWHPPAIDHGGAAASHPVREGEPYDVVIAGAGPAGLSASLSALQQGLYYLALEQSEIASTIRNYPRHKFLLAEPVEMPLYGNLYVSDGTKEALLQVWETIVANTGVRIQVNERVETVVRENGLLRVESQKGRYLARHVVLALGKRGMPRKLGVPGEELGKVAYRLIEAGAYSGSDILVVGGGDSAIEAALALSRSGSNRVTLSYRGDTFQRARERNRAALADAEAAGQLTILTQSNVLEIRPESVRLDIQGSSRELRNDFVFVLIGGESPEAFLRRAGIEIVEKVITA